MVDDVRSEGQPAREFGSGFAGYLESAVTMSSLFGRV